LGESLISREIEAPVIRKRDYYLVENVVEKYGFT
jgi:hypothetical protein